MWWKSGHNEIQYNQLELLDYVKFLIIEFRTILTNQFETRNSKEILIVGLKKSNIFITIKYKFISFTIFND